MFLLTKILYRLKNHLLRSSKSIPYERMDEDCCEDQVLKRGECVFEERLNFEEKRGEEPVYEEPLTVEEPIYEELIEDPTYMVMNSPPDCSVLSDSDKAIYVDMGGSRSVPVLGDQADQPIPIAGHLTSESMLIPFFFQLIAVIDQHSHLRPMDAADRLSPRPYVHVHITCFL